MKPIETSLCYIFYRQGRCLMQRRQREPHRGQWNAPGGKLLVGETPEAACRREVREETGLTLDRVLALGSVDCIDLEDADNAWRLHLFTSRHPLAPVAPGQEGELAWLEPAFLVRGGEEVVHNIPLILPLIIRGVPLQGRFEYRGEFLVRYNISLTNGGRGLRI